MSPKPEQPPDGLGTCAKHVDSLQLFSVGPAEPLFGGRELARGLFNFSRLCSGTRQWIIASIYQALTPGWALTQLSLTIILQKESAITFMLQMERLRHEKAKCPAQGYTASKWQSRDLNLGSLALPRLLAPVL